MKIQNEQDCLETFNGFCKNIQELEKNINFNVSNQIVKDEWQSNRINFKNKICNIDSSFLENTGIGGLMFQSDISITNEEIKIIDEKLIDKITEHKISNLNFEINDKKLSTNTIHHLYHIKNFLNNKINENKIVSALEWGGGYGNMCKLSFEIFEDLKTYTIIDLPEFMLIQYIFLSSYFGKDNVRIINNLTEIKEGINLISVNNINNVQVAKADLFISNWALSESTLYCQELAENNGFLNYPNQLISFHQCGDHIPFMNESTILKNKLINKNFKIIEITVIPGINYYAIT